MRNHTVMCATIAVVLSLFARVAVSRKLAFAPTPLPDGIELSGDPFPALHSAVYALSVKHRQQEK